MLLFVIMLVLMSQLAHIERCGYLICMLHLLKLKAFITHGFDESTASLDCCTLKPGARL